MKGTRAMTATERSRNRRERIKETGGRTLSVSLDAAAVANLESLMARLDVGVTEAIRIALEQVRR